jgi:hypothetical protein
LRQKCYVAANAYYGGLRGFAKGAFEKRQKAVCACDPKNVHPAPGFPPRELLLAPRTGKPLSWLDYQLILPRFAGYRVFQDQAAYERYFRDEKAHEGTLKAEPQVAPPARPQESVPRSLRMR